jgi:hypothetical protein
VECGDRTGRFRLDGVWNVTMTGRPEPSTSPPAMSRPPLASAGGRGDVWPLTSLYTGHRTGRQGALPCAPGGGRVPRCDDSMTAASGQDAPCYPASDTGMPHSSPLQRIRRCLTDSPMKMAVHFGLSSDNSVSRIDIAVSYWQAWNAKSCGHDGVAPTTSMTHLGQLPGGSRVMAGAHMGSKGRV